MVDAYAPWHPISDPVDLKHLGKLSEELGEGVQAIGRCIIQGMTEHNEKEGQSNLACLEDEIADIEANIELVKRRFNLDRQRIVNRAERKIPLLQSWHEMA